ncbi:hypothetical protein MK079_01410 [Candidatus Gracilibacteria bacterium]|nr:hypothetical protein [Candidatus Gracilibacteria bacterium]
MKTLKILLIPFLILGTLSYVYAQTGFFSNIGIGTQNPLTGLHIVGQDDDLNRNIYVQGDGEYRDHLLHLSSNIAGGPASGNHVNNTKFIVRGNGSTGLGTYTPEARLDVKGDVFVKRVKLDSDESQTGPTSAGMIRWSGEDFEGYNGTEWVSLTQQTIVIQDDTSPSGEVAAFNLDTCPQGWSEYLPAQGRFIRGIDKTGTNIDPTGQRALGNIQEDEFKSHSHRFPGIDYGGFFSNGNGLSVGGSMSYSYTQPEGGAETRPKNVALLYCEKQ